LKISCNYFSFSYLVLEDKKPFFAISGLASKKTASLLLSSKDVVLVVSNDDLSKEYIALLDHFGFHHDCVSNVWFYS